MQAVILAGGLGTRMHPETLLVPKILLEVAGRPFVEWQLERLRSAGFERVLFCVGHLGERVEAEVGDGARFGVEARFAFDGPRLLGTAGALRRALAELDGTFLVTYGDSYLPFDYAAPLRDLRADDAALGSMSVYRNQGRWEVSNTAVEGDRVTIYDKRGSGLDFVDYGALALRRSVIVELPEGEPRGLEEVQARLAREGRLRAVRAHERFYEIGSPSGRRELERHLRQNA